MVNFNDDAPTTAAYAVLLVFAAKFVLREVYISQKFCTHKKKYVDS